MAIQDDQLVRGASVYVHYEHAHANGHAAIQDGVPVGLVVAMEPKIFLKKCKEICMLYKVALINICDMSKKKNMHKPIR